MSAKWSGQAIRVEHLIAPGDRLNSGGSHMAACPCRCDQVQTCSRCGKPSWPASISGRWDEENGYTARPFDAVWVALSCGCQAGDKSLADPPKRNDPTTTQGGPDDQ